jgi:hypothetical protein
MTQPTQDEIVARIEVATPEEMEAIAEARALFAWLEIVDKPKTPAGIVFVADDRGCPYHNKTEQSVMVVFNSVPVWFGPNPNAEGDMIARLLTEQELKSYKNHINESELTIDKYASCTSTPAADTTTLGRDEKGTGGDGSGSVYAGVAEDFEGCEFARPEGAGFGDGRSTQDDANGDVSDGEAREVGENVRGAAGIDTGGGDDNDGGVDLEPSASAGEHGGSQQTDRAYISNLGTVQAIGSAASDIAVTGNGQNGGIAIVDGTKRGGAKKLRGGQSGDDDDKCEQHGIGGELQPGAGGTTPIATASASIPVPADAAGRIIDRGRGSFTGGGEIHERREELHSRGNAGQTVTNAELANMIDAANDLTRVTGELSNAAKLARKAFELQQKNNIKPIEINFDEDNETRVFHLLSMINDMKAFTSILNKYTLSIFREIFLEK